jgi:2-C-methyl-D-erythritol 4-phosphate cytidylyltransferase
VTAITKQVKDNPIFTIVDRGNLYKAETPQVFDRSLLLRAYANLKNVDAGRISDDSQLVEAIGEKVAIVEADSSNIKITRHSDYAIAEAIIQSRPKPKTEGYTGPFIKPQR